MVPARAYVAFSTLLVVLTVCTCTPSPPPQPVTPPTPSACPSASLPPPTPTADAAPFDAGVADAPEETAAATATSGGAQVHVKNETANTVVVFVTFGSDSIIRPASWSAFCTSFAAGSCQFPLATQATQRLPLGGQYLNATLSFNRSATCGATKAEVNVNNPKWYDIADVSLVDGYSDKIKITATEPGVDGGSAVLGPPVGRERNERVFGVFPLGCDICVAREHPPCGMKPGKTGCKSGSQFKPDVPCQYQGSVMSGGTALTIALVP